ncbi:hypothetical protein ACFVHS_20200 [Streptomyces sp. NPDC057746]
MIVIALLVPVVLLLMMFGLDALENALFPPPEPRSPEAPVPEQSPPE